VLSEVFGAYVKDGWFARCSRRVCLFSRSDPRFLVEHDFWTQAQIDDNPIYRDFFRPQGLGWSAGTGLMMPTGDHIVFSVERAYARGPVEKERVQALDELRPHLARAAFIAARLGLKSAQGANTALGTLGLPALVLDEAGVVIEANAQIEALSAHVQSRAHNRVVLTDARANALLLAALPTMKQDAAMATGAANAVQSFALRDLDGNAAMVAHLLPIRRSAHDIFARSYALLVITPVTARRLPPVELLRSLFDLTPSEARVARSLATGDSLDDIATHGGVSRNTVRAQLRQVLEKIGCTRQGEVVALLSNLSLAAGEAAGQVNVTAD
jgi:DNA-binding CsgD family transcriptional regulator